MDVSSLLTGIDPAQLTNTVRDVFASQGGVNGLLDRLRGAGLGPQVDSWISTGSNEPIEPQRLGEALGPETVNQLSASSGLSIQVLLPLLAQFLPMIIDRLTPDGQAPAPGAEQSGGLPDIGDLVGGVLGGGGLGSLLGGGR
jgi:uncharacterized protein YidB (DUF937 family)